MEKGYCCLLAPSKKTLRWPVLGLVLRPSFNYANSRMCNTFGLEYSSVIRTFENNSTLWAYCLSAEHGASAVGSDNRSLAKCQMALMHDYVRRANFTTKPRLQGKFFAFALFLRGYSFQIYCLGTFFYAKLRNFTIQNEAWWRNLLIWRKHA